MAITTVRHGTRETGPAKAKGGSGFSIKAWLFGAAEPDDEPQPAEPDEQLRRLRGVLRAELQEVVKALSKPQAPEAPRPVQGDLAVYNIHPRALLRRIQHLTVDLDADPSLGTRDCDQALREVMDEFRRAALDEDRAQTQYETRTGRNKRAAEAKGHRLTVAALDDGEDAQLKTARVETADGEVREYLPGSVSKIVANALHASDPRPTALQVALTPDVLRRLDAGEPVGDVAATQVLPRVAVVPASAAANPVHVPGEGLRPAIAAGPDEQQDADTGTPAPPHPWDGAVRSDGSTPPAPLSAAEVQPAIPEGKQADPEPPALPRRKAAAARNGRVES